MRVRWSGLFFWLAIAGACAVALWVVRERVDRAHMALLFLLVVLGGSARQGRVVGLILSLVCFLAFNFLLLPPLYTLRIAQPIDLGVLFAFLITAGVAAEMLHRQRMATEMAERRAREMDRLAALGAESLSVARAEDAVVAITRVIRSELPVAAAGIHQLADTTEPEEEGSGDLIEFAARRRRLVCVRGDGTSHVEPEGVALTDVLANAAEFTGILLPLQVRNRVVGVLRLDDAAGLHFDDAQARFADVLAYYAALAVERVRLAAAAEHAEALREADQLKDALLASVSHDLRTPLTSIRATANELRLGGEARAALIEEEAERLNRMVADLLDLSRLRAGALPLSIEINAAEDLAGAALQRLTGIPGADDIAVRLPADGTLPVGRFDFVHSLRALTNLLENALRHSPSGVPVELEVEQGETDLVFRVLDRGAGVAPAHRAKLFDPFFRTAAGSADHGAGLGLAIARSVAEAQEGAVTFTPRPGGGSIFELRLPAVRIGDMPEPADSGEFRSVRKGDGGMRGDMGDLTPADRTSRWIGQHLPRHESERGLRSRTPVTRPQSHAHGCAPLQERRREREPQRPRERARFLNYFWFVCIL